MSAKLARIDSAPAPSALSRFQPENLEQAMKVADVLARSGLLPEHLRGKPADVLATLIAGAEMGLGMMQAFRAIYLVKGKVGFYADFMLAKAKQHPRCVRFDMVESNNERATFETEEVGGKVTPLTYTLAQAQASGATRNPTYAAHPEAMLRARCISALVKLVYPDAFFGASSMEEVSEIEEREINAPPIKQEPKEPIKPASGVAGALETLKARAAAPLVVDVAGHETEEQAKVRAEVAASATNVPRLEFGDPSMKGTPLSELTAGQLADYLEEARRYVTEFPKSKWAGAMRAQAEALSLELEARQAELKT